MNFHVKVLERIERKIAPHLHPPIHQLQENENEILIKIMHNRKTAISYIICLLLSSLCQDEVLFPDLDKIMQVLSNCYRMSKLVLVIPSLCLRG